MKIFLFEDIQKTLSNKEDFWLNLGILFYTALLPFNAFSFHVFPGPYFRLNVTKAALLLVVIFGLHAYFHNRLVVKKAYLLYSFLILQILANFLSILVSLDPRESILLAMTVSQYSFLVFLLVNVIRSEILLRAILRVMGVVVVIIVIHSVGIFLWRGGVFFTRTQASLLGNNIGHYLSYCLLMFGPGLVYMLFTIESKRLKGLLWMLTGLWIFVIHINAMKISQIVLLLFLSLLLVTLPKKRKEVVALITLTTVLFFLVLGMAPIMDTLWAAANWGSYQMLGSDAETLVRAAPGNSLYYRWVVGGNSLQVRVRGWLSGLLIGISHPLLGVGVGQTEHYIDDYGELVRENTRDFLPKLPFRKYVFTDAVFPPGTFSIFNIFLNAWVETGIFGLVAIIGIIFTVIAKGFSVFLLADRSDNMNALCFFLPLFLSILLYHQFVYFWVHPWLWTIIALTYAAADIFDVRVQRVGQ